MIRPNRGSGTAQAWRRPWPGREPPSGRGEVARPAAAGKRPSTKAMHGTLLSELESYLSGRFGPSVWPRTVAHAGFGRFVHDPLATYPEVEAEALLAAACTVTGEPRAALLEAFGRFLGPRLLHLYWGLIDPAWGPLDVIERVEDSIHRLVRLEHAEAAPPALTATRPDPATVVLTYDSPRRLCALARGIGRGLGDHYGQPLAVEDRLCVERGDASCVLVFRAGAGPSPRG